MMKFRVTSPRGQEFDDDWSTNGSAVKLTGVKSIRRSQDRPRFLIAKETGRIERRSSVPNDAFVSLSESYDPFR